MSTSWTTSVVIELELVLHLYLINRHSHAFSYAKIHLVQRFKHVKYFLNYTNSANGKFQTADE